MKKLTSFILVVAATAQLKSQAPEPTVIPGDLEVGGELLLNHGIDFNNKMAISLIAGSGGLPHVLIFGKPTGVDNPFPLNMRYHAPCNIWHYDPTQYDITGQPYSSATWSPITANIFQDLLQITSDSLSAPSNAALSIGVFDGDGIIALEPFQYSESNKKLKINPGCANDVYICEGGGTTKIFYDANMFGKLSVGNDFAGNDTAQLNVFTSGNSALNIFDQTGELNYKVEANGKTIIGNQQSAPNSALLNVNVAGTSSAAATAFNMFDGYNNKVNFQIKSDGKTIIGNKTITSGSHTDALLTVNGKIVGKEVVATPNNWGWADFVFSKNYNLPTLKHVEDFYTKHGHLENIPSEKEVMENGIDLAEMNKLLLQKIEESTIYIVELNKQMEAMSKQISFMQEKIKRLEKEK